MQGYKDIGELLAREREERRMTIDDVANALHIRPRYIMALEEGDIAAMPGLPYAKGYLTRYVKYLSLDCVEILRRFELVAQEAVGSNFFMPHTFSRDKRVDATTAMLCTVGAILALLLWAVLRPGQTPPSVVQPAPVKEKAIAAPKPSKQTLQRVACLQPENRLNPSCNHPPEARKLTIKPVPSP